MRTLLISSVIALLTVASSVDAFLFPQCPTGTEVHSKTFHPKGNVAQNFVDVTFSKSSGETAKVVTQELRLDCLGYTVYVHPFSQMSETCSQDTVADRQNKPWRLLLVATDVEDSANTRYWDLDDVIGGSIDSQRFRAGVSSNWRFMALNQVKDNDNCGISLNIVFVAENAYNVSNSGIVTPSIVDIKPTTVVQNQKVFIALKQQGIFDFRGKARYYKPYGANSYMDWLSASSLSWEESGLQVHGSKRDHALFFGIFPQAGTYIIEFQHYNSTEWFEIARLIVFTGSPAYYVISEGAGDQGQLYENQDTVINFHGENLGPWDQVKFIDESKYFCHKDAPAAGGYDAAVNVTAETMNSTLATWKLKLTKSGFLKLCYARKADFYEWHAVPNYADLPHRADSDMTMPPGGKYPVPTHAENGLPCGVVPTKYIEDMATVPSFLILTLNTNSLSFAFRQDFCNIFCLDHDNLIIMKLKHKQDDPTKPLQLYINIDCSDSPSGKKYTCSSIERMAAVRYQWSQNQGPLKSIGVTELLDKELDAEYVVESEEPQIISTPKNRNQTAVTVVIIFAVLGIIGICVYCFIKKHQKGNNEAGKYAAQAQPATAAERGNAYRDGQNNADRQEFEMVH